MTPRLPPLEPPYSPELAEELRAIMPGGLEPIRLFRTLAHSPRVLRKVDVVDLTGTDDHLEARVVSAAFEGKTPVERHRMVYAPLRDWIDDDTVHALAVKAWTPQQYRTLTSEE